MVGDFCSHLSHLEICGDFIRFQYSPNSWVMQQLDLVRNSGSHPMASAHVPTAGRERAKAMGKRTGCEIAYSMVYSMVYSMIYRLM